MEASKFSFLSKTASCSNAVEAFELISAIRPDIIFVDIAMPGISGIDLVKALSAPAPLPVFITSHPEFAVESYALQAFDYLLKPVDSLRFEKCALRIRDFFELQQNAFAFNKEQESNDIIIKQGHNKHRISMSDIAYLEAMKDYTKIVTSSKNYLVLETITGIHERLPQEKFLRIHRSYIVNKEKVESVKAHSVWVHKTELPVGKMYKHVIGGMLD